MCHSHSTNAYVSCKLHHRPLLHWCITARACLVDWVDPSHLVGNLKLPKDAQLPTGQLGNLCNHVDSATAGMPALQVTLSKKVCNNVHLGLVCSVLYGFSFFCILVKLILICVSCSRDTRGVRIAKFIFFIVPTLFFFMMIVMYDT